MRRFVKSRYWLVLSFVTILIFASGCASGGKPTRADSTVEKAYPAIDQEPSGSQSGYPAIDQEPSGSQSAYPSGEDRNELPQPVDPQKIVAPNSAPKPENDKASASGVIYSISSRTVLWDFDFYLTPAKGDNHDEVPALLVGSFKEKGDIPIKADKKGEFQVNDIPPGNYYIILIAPGNYLVAVNSPTDPTPRMITFKSNEAKPLGLIYFP